MRVRSYAKVNLVLQVTSKREDGYHNIDSIMSLVNLFDILEINVNDSGEINLSSNVKYIPLNDKNIVYNCLKKMQEEFKFKQGFDVHITKKIPVQAGLGGGSSNGAYAILAANKLLKLNLSDEQLIDVGAKVGADIPFFIKNSLAHVSGIGEIVDPFKSEMEFYIVLVKNRKGVSTPKAYSNLKINENYVNYVEKAKEAMLNNDYEGLVNSMVNDLEKPVIEFLGEIAEIKQELDNLGFDKSLMSGSGSTVFGITKDKELAEKAVQELRKKFNYVYLTNNLKPDDFWKRK